MRLARALEQAQDATTERQAAKLYNGIEHELAYSDNEDDYEQGEQALHLLERKFPGVAEQARQITTPPSLSRNAKRNLEHQGGGHVGEAKTRRQHQLEGRSRTGVRQRVIHATQIHARPRRRYGGGGLGRRVDQTGIPAAADSVAELTMKTVGLIFGLSFLGLLVSPEGSRAVTTASNSATDFLGALISPTADPLRSSTWPGAVTSPLGPGMPSAASLAAERTIAKKQATAGVIDTPGGGTAPWRPVPGIPTTKGATK